MNAELHAGKLGGSPFAPSTSQSTRPPRRPIAVLIILALIALGLMILPRPTLYYPNVVIDADGEMKVHNDTRRLYATFDATALVEYLFERVVDTVHTDLRDELAFIRTFDRALEAVAQQIDMPGQKASLFVRLCLQNNGRLSGNKRAKFRELSDADVERLEDAIRGAVGATTTI